MRTRTRLLLALTLTLTLVLPSAVSACPNCKEAVATETGGQANGTAQKLSQGYAYSIMLMMGMPLALLGTGAFLVTRAVKRGALPPM
jgi:hypothetical protein